MRLEIGIDDPAWKAIADLRQLARAALKASLPAENVAVSVLFTSDDAMRKLNQAWRGKDMPTNVLSFPSSRPAPPGEPRHVGDIALAHGTIAAEAQDQGKSISHHTAHLLVHGALHLLGYDHETEQEAEAMEARETAILAGLGIDNPYR
jgi:probable rRNA maturation factor